MTRLLLPLLISLAASPALAGYTFEIPRFDFPAPAPMAPDLPGTLASNGN